MSLTVRTYTRDANTGMIELLDFELGKHLAGFEDSRCGFWGASVMVTLGLTLLPSLGKGNDIAAEGNTLNQLELEVGLLRENLQLIMRETGYDEYFVNTHAENILYAIRRAQDVHGGVVIS